MDRLERLCSERGFKLTEHRRIVLRVLETSTDHPCAREIHRRAAVGHRIGLATVYRTLNSFSAAGIVVRHTFADGKTRYAGADTPSRDHLVDIHTGEILDVRDDEVARLAEAVARQLGYRLVDYRLRLFGEENRGKGEVAASAPVSPPAQRP